MKDISIKGLAQTGGLNITETLKMIHYQYSAVSFSAAVT